MIGVAWEIVEPLVGLGYSPWLSYPVDTAKDILCDVLGAFIATMIARL
jgi:hypothetical protein